MGRRPYLNSLALGRSPYEAPELIVNGSAIPQPNRHLSNSNADGYTQEYDARGHPINRRSKAEARQLRKAKNDVLSTMGIIVSGEELNSASMREQEKIALLAEENDYGLALAAIDQLGMFGSSWWTKSLACRIQTFKSYNLSSLTDTILRERQRIALLVFILPGFRFGLYLFCYLFADHISESLDSLIRPLSSGCKWYKNCPWPNECISFGANSAVILILGQGYMFSLLQSLHLLPPFSIPSVYSFIPFTANSLIQLPPLPSEFSVRTVGLYGLSLATSPFILFNVYINVRPVVEARVYRILRRRLPKPDRPDKLSLRVAVENELIEWTVPSLGKRSEEEIKRSNLTLAQEIKYELVTLKNWLCRSVGFHPTAKPKPAPEEAPWLERYESVQRRVEQLQQDLGLGTSNSQDNHDTPLPGAGQESHSSQINDVDPVAQILVDEENRFAQSPIQLPEGYFSDMRASIQPSGNDTALSTPSQHDIPLHPGGSATPPSHVPASRTNTLFSPSPSPESSPPSSPRVRASLIHQNSDVITMHLELLQSHTEAEVDNQGLNASVSLPNGVVHRTESQTSAIDRAASELLDALLSNPSQHSVVNVPTSNRERGHSTPNIPVQNGIDPTAQPPEEELDAVWQTPGMNHSAPNPQDNISSSSSEHMPNGTGPQRQPLLDRPGPQAAEEWDHHVTILSSHPVDAFSSHLSSIITSVLFYPFESLYLRSLAFTYLSTQSAAIILPLGATASLVGLHSNVRPLSAWFGGGNAPDMLSYVGKMVLTVGYETAISAGIWGLGASAAVALGKIKFQWGQL
ncbi:hypothetical protein MGYG_04687 [Nannizzia gypsea CBS 118893]|uniref:Uncharacterized protein n=1 Tax=Arthroderma gypseum (strain ATCC MYA-4604 / CBS 118893) TaxID=535722 RepID=E4UW76_ARTGP|nr:hypothetical protein MGYG_04687 [Nannizzia gypsea CBS 118893]EFR01684.1 hypothetical protein MGYG_04687 [Nannizzia gypsea CBS 118893]